MRLLATLTTTIILMFFTIKSKGYGHEQGEKHNLKVEQLLNSAQQFDLKNEIEDRDSVFDLVIEYVYLNVDDTLLLNTYNWYFEKDEEYFTDRAIEYAKDFAQLANKKNDPTWLCRSNMALAKLNLYQFKNEKALEKANYAFYYASLTDNYSTKVFSMLLLGTCLEKTNKKIEAFKKYTDALYLSKQKEDNTLIFECYQSLAAFYSLIYNIEKAKEYKVMQLRMLKQAPHVDSLEFMQQSVYLAGYLFDQNNFREAKNITNKVLGYALRHNYFRLKERMFTTYRAYIINNSHFKELSQLYMKDYPNELNDIRQNNPTLYYRLQAFISEADNKVDSSAYYYSLAEELLSKNGQGNVFLSNFYKRYGEFLLRRNDLNGAEIKLEKAFQYAQAAQYLPYLTEISHELDSLKFSQGKTADAYKFAKLNLQYNKQAELVHQEEELLKLEVENEAKQREMLAHREAEATERKHNIQYMGICIAIILSFLVLAMIASFKIPSFVLKAIGFFSFIFLFEFIIMLADHKIHHITHGEPWKFMAFKIVLIAILLPLHHWLEHKVIHYLSNHKLIDTSKLSLKGFIKKLSKPKAEMVKEALEKQVPTEKH